MLLDLWEGLNTKCLAIASPTEVAKVHEVQASLIPLTEFLNKAKYLGLFRGT